MVGGVRRRRLDKGMNAGMASPVTRIMQLYCQKFRMPPMKLIASLASPYARKVRVVMAEKKIDYEFVGEDVWASDSRITEFNPLGKVPCLIMEDGGALFDSRVIVEYLDNLTPLHRLIPPSGRARTAVKCWEALADGLTDAAILIRIEFTRREEHERSAKWVARQRGKVDAALKAMSKGLGDNAWCCEDGYSLADIATGCALSWIDFRFPEWRWRIDYPNLAGLVERLDTRASFAATRPC